MKVVEIGGQRVGDGYPVYIIAEIGINHEGSCERAKDMIQAAWETGVDAVKIQTFITKDFLHPSHPSYRYDIEAEIPPEREQELWDFARARKINLFSTPEEFKSLAFIQRQNPALIKIAAMDFNYQELVQAAAALQKPIILSSGMSTLEEVLRTVRWVEETGNNNYIVLHCVSCYPALPEDCNLRAIGTLKRTLGCPVGFSDHTAGLHIPLAAVALGANVIEKHFTLDKKMAGPDHRCSADPGEMKEFIAAVRDLESASGDGVKQPAAGEAAPRRFKRRGIYAVTDLPAGETLTREKVAFMAPSVDGSTLEDWPRMAGSRLKRPVAAQSAIKMDDIASE
jgi:N,N'-diacetyllegionaminate synthase